MKKLLLLFIFIPSFLIAQEGDWFPVPSDQVSFYSNITNSIKWEFYNIQAIRIDSIVEYGNLKYYFNVRTPVGIGVDEVYDIVYYDPFSSWIGKYIIFFDGKARFYSSRNTQYEIQYQKRDTIPWLFAVPNDTSYIMARIDSIKNMEIVDGVMDSVKYISFKVYNSDHTLQDQTLNNRFIILSKNYGWVKVFPFANLYSLKYYNTLILIGLQKDDISYGFEWNYDELITNYEVGGEYQLKYSGKSNETIDHDTQYYLFDKEIENEKLIYTYQVCIDKDDGIMITYEQAFSLNLLPGQSIFSEYDSLRGFIEYTKIKDDFYNRKAYETRNYQNVHQSYYNNQYVWWRNIDIGLWYYPPYGLTTDFGSFIYRLGEDAGNTFTYFKNDGETWGEPREFNCNVGISKLTNSQLYISPNPSNGRMTLNNSGSQKIEAIQIYNINGELIYKQQNIAHKQELDLQFLHSGLYMIKIQLDNNQVVNEKIMIQK